MAVRFFLNQRIQTKTVPLASESPPMSPPIHPLAQGANASIRTLTRHAEPGSSDHLTGVRGHRLGGGAQDALGTTSAGRGEAKRRGRPPRGGSARRWRGDLAVGSVIGRSFRGHGPVPKSCAPQEMNLVCLGDVQPSR